MLTVNIEIKWSGFWVFNHKFPRSCKLRKLLFNSLIILVFEDLLYLEPHLFVLLNPHPVLPNYHLHYSIVWWAPIYMLIIILKGSDRHGSWTEYIVLWTIVFRIHLRHVKSFYDVYLLSLRANLTFKIRNLGWYVFRIVFFQLSNKDDKKYSKHSTVN